MLRLAARENQIHNAVDGNIEPSFSPFEPHPPPLRAHRETQVTGCTLTVRACSRLIRDDRDCFSNLAFPPLLRLGDARGSPKGCTEEKTHITLKQNQRNQNVVSYIGPVKYIFSYCWVPATASLVPDSSQSCDFVLVFNHVLMGILALLLFVFHREGSP